MASEQPQMQRNKIIENWGSIQAPYSQEAEDALIGALLINPTAYDDVVQVMKSEDLFIRRNRFIFDAIQTLSERQSPVDYITVLEELKGKSQLEEIGGGAYLTQLCNRAPDSQNAVVYAQLVQRFATRRLLLAYGDDVQRLALDESREVSEIISDVENKQIEIAARVVGTKTQTMHAAVSSYFDRVDKLRNNPNDTSGIPTGFKDLDHVFMGLDEQALTLLGARPGMGKTAMMLSMAMNMVRAGYRVGFFSLEMGVDQLVGRLVAMDSGISSQRLRAGQLSNDEWGRFVKATGDLHSLPLFIDDTTTWTPLQLHAKCSSMKRRNGIDMFFVDYVGLMSGGGRYKDNKVAEAGFISRSLKGLARDLKTPVMGAIQLSRAVEQRADKRPILSDLRESGDWEQDADNVMFIYRDEVYNEATETPGQADIIIAKHRNGPVGTVNLYFQKELTLFKNAQSRNFNLVTGDAK